MPNTLIPIQTVTLSSTTTSITFSSIPQNYTDLKFVMSLRTTDSNSNYSPIGIQVNGATPGNSYKSVAGNGSSTVNYGTSNDTFTASTAGGSWTRLSSSGVQPGSTTASVFSSNEFYITNYTSSTTKSYSFDSVTESNSTTAYAELTAGTITSSSAITSIVFANRDGSWAANSTVTLYGISNGVKATGGTLTVAGGYAYHTFTSTSSFLPTQQIKGADYLVVAGGAGGGVDTYSENRGAGGGGAGGLRSTLNATGGGGGLESKLNFEAGTICTVLVGAGGAGSAAGSNTGTNGSDSVLKTITATGGGGGGGHPSGNNVQGANGGSGGGSANNYASGGSGVLYQGYAGGGGSYGPGYEGGGGGGAGAVGATGVSGTPGVGGAGVSISSFSVPTNTGVNTFYAGGGGGRGTNGNAAGGAGGGGAGGGTAGTANTGSGGGANRNATAGAGGSGIVIVRYPLD